MLVGVDDLGGTATGSGGGSLLVLSNDECEGEYELVVVGQRPGACRFSRGMLESQTRNANLGDEHDPQNQDEQQRDDQGELDDERVLVLHRYSGIAKTSGLEIGQMAAKGADLFHVGDGKVTRLILYWELGRALTDLGLSA